MVGNQIRRREFVRLLGGPVALLSFGASAQTPTLPVVGILSASSPGGMPRRLPAILQGLKDSGYVEGRDVAIENRWAYGQYDRLPALAVDLVQRRVAVIVTTGGNVPVLAAKAATATIPIVFTIGDDPVGVGLVASVGRPGGNVTGVSLHTTELVEKRQELLRELAPEATTIALLVAGGSETTTFAKEHVEKAGRAAGLKVLVLEVGPLDDFETAIAAAVQQGAAALLVSAAPIFMGQRARIVALSARYALPAVYPWREFTEQGGLMSYGPDLGEAYYQVGRYVGRILHGASPRELPVQLPTRFELVINLGTARALGLKISRLLNARADKVIE